MDKQKFSSPLSLRDVQIKDAFWKKEMELVRTEVIPYQWAALNDQVEGAAPSYCMHNFKAAGKQNEERRELGKEFREPFCSTCAPSTVLSAFWSRCVAL